MATYLELKGDTFISRDAEEWRTEQMTTFRVGDRVIYNSPSKTPGKVVYVNGPDDYFAGMVDVDFDCGWQTTLHADELIPDPEPLKWGDKVRLIGSDAIGEVRGVFVDGGEWVCDVEGFPHKERGYKASLLEIVK